MIMKKRNFKLCCLLIAVVMMLSAMTSTVWAVDYEGDDEVAYDDYICCDHDYGYVEFDRALEFFDDIFSIEEEHVHNWYDPMNQQCSGSSAYCKWINWICRGCSAYYNEVTQYHIGINIPPQGWVCVGCGHSH